MPIARRPKVIVLDTDGLNPYGSELAALLVEFADVVVAGPMDNAFQPDNVVWRPLRPTRSEATLLDRLKEGTVILALCRAVLVGQIVVVVWARTYQKLMLLCAAWTRPHPRLVYVSHNPGSGRNHPGRIQRLTERWLLGRARVVVTHSEALRTAARNDGAHIASVVPHLPYRAYCAALGIGGPARRSDDPTRIQLLFLGALRPDKFTISEIEHLRDLLADGTDRYRLIAAVRPSVNLPATEPEVSVLNMSSDQPLSDDTVAKALAQADALVAPYRNATDSGTVMLALSAGLPVLAFETGALGTHLTKESLVPVDDWHSLAKKCTNAKQMSVSHEWAQDVQNEARAAWRGVIASAWL